MAFDDRTVCKEAHHRSSHIRLDRTKRYFRFAGFAVAAFLGATTGFAGLATFAWSADLADFAGSTDFAGLTDFAAFAETTTPDLGEALPTGADLTGEAAFGVNLAGVTFGVFAAFAVSAGFGFATSAALTGAFPPTGFAADFAVSTTALATDLGLAIFATAFFTSAGFAGLTVFAAAFAATGFGPLTGFAGNAGLAVVEDFVTLATVMGSTAFDGFVGLVVVAALAETAGLVAFAALVAFAGLAEPAGLAAFAGFTDLAGFSALAGWADPAGSEEPTGFATAESLAVIAAFTPRRPGFAPADSSTVAAAFAGLAPRLDFATGTAESLESEEESDEPVDTSEAAGVPTSASSIPRRAESNDATTKRWVSPRRTTSLALRGIGMASPASGT